MVGEDCRALSLMSRTKFLMIWGDSGAGFDGNSHACWDSLHVLTDRCYHKSRVKELLTQLYILGLKVYGDSYQVILWQIISTVSIEGSPLDRRHVNVWQWYVAMNEWLQYIVIVKPVAKTMQEMPNPKRSLPLPAQYWVNKRPHNNKTCGFKWDETKSQGLQVALNFDKEIRRAVKQGHRNFCVGKELI